MKKLLIGIELVALLGVIASIVFSALSIFAVKPLFLHNIRNVSDSHSTIITPPYWTFWIWFLIYPTQMIWALYALLEKRGSEAATKTNVGFYAMGALLTVPWLFLFDRGHFIPALVVLAAAAVCLNVSATSLSKRVVTYQPVDAAGYRIFFINAIVTFASWLEVATLLNLALVLKDYEVDDGVTSGVCLSILVTNIGVWMIMDGVWLLRYTRLLFAPYIVWLWAAIGIAVNTDDSAVRIIVSILAGVVGFALIARTAIVIALSCVMDVEGEYRVRYEKAPAAEMDEDVLVFEAT